MSTNAISATNTVKAVGRLEDNDLLYLTISNNAFTSVASVGNVTVRDRRGRHRAARPTSPRSRWDRARNGCWSTTTGSRR